MGVPTSGCVRVRTGERLPSPVLLPLPHFSLEARGPSLVTQELPGVIWAPVPSSSDSPLPPPILSHTSRHVPGPRHSGAAPALEGTGTWGQGTLLSTTPTPDPQMPQ